MSFDFSKYLTIKNAYSHIHEMFNGDDDRDRVFMPEPVKCSFGDVLGFFYDDDTTIYLIYYDAEEKTKMIIETEAKDVSSQIESDAKILADSLQRDIERQADEVAQAAENTVKKIFNALSKFGL